MELKGKIIEVLEPVTGQGKNGTWKKQEVVIETPGQYPKKVCVEMWGDTINESILQIGTEVTAQIDVESREYNGRWYTVVKAWKIESAYKHSQTSQETPTPPFIKEETGDDLPF